MEAIKKIIPFELLNLFEKQGAILALLTSSFFINLLSLALPVVLLQMYDRIIPRQATSTLFLLMLGLIIAVLFEMILRIGRLIISAWVDAQFDHQMSTEAIQGVMETPRLALAREGPGAYFEKLQSLAVLKDFYTHQSIAVLFDLPFAVIYLSLFIYIAGSLVWVPLVTLSIFSLLTYQFGKMLEIQITQKRNVHERRSNFLIETMRNMHTVKAFAMEPLLLRRYERLLTTSAQADYELGLNEATIATFGQITALITVGGIVAFGSLMVIHHNLTVGGLAACTLLGTRLLQPIGQAITVWSRLQAIRDAKTRLATITALPKEAAADQIPLMNFSGNFTLQNVSIRYPEQYVDVLSDINLSIREKETIAIRGEGLSGKSSLLLLLNSTIHPSSGSLLLDGKEARHFTPESIRQHISYLPQHGVLFEGTLLDNLTMFDDSKTEEAKRLAASLGLDNIIDHLPKGYLTELSEQAITATPRGIKQRIVIVRGLVSNPSVILFDEANAAMDWESDKKLKQLLLKMKRDKTIIIVSHRPSLLELADRQWIIKNGKVYESSHR